MNAHTRCGLTVSQRKAMMFVLVHGTCSRPCEGCVRGARQRPAASKLQAMPKAKGKVCSSLVGLRCSSVPTRPLSTPRSVAGQRLPLLRCRVSWLSTRVSARRPPSWSERLLYKKSRTARHRGCCLLSTLSSSDTVPHPPLPFSPPTTGPVGRRYSTRTSLSTSCPEELYV